MKAWAACCSKHSMTGGTDKPEHNDDCYRLKIQEWCPNIDPATIPDDVLRSEWGRRNNAKRKTKGAGPGRPRKTAAVELEPRYKPRKATEALPKVRACGVTHECTVITAGGKDIGALCGNCGIGLLPRTASRGDKCPHCGAPVVSRPRLYDRNATGELVEV